MVGLSSIRVGSGTVVFGAKPWIAWQFDNVDVRIAIESIGDELSLGAMNCRAPVITGALMRTVPLGRIEAALRTRQFRYLLEGAWRWPAPDLGYHCTTTTARAWLDNAKLIEWDAVAPVIANGRRSNQWYVEFVEYYYQRQAQRTGAAKELMREYGVPGTTIAQWVRNGTTEQLRAEWTRKQCEICGTYFSGQARTRTCRREHSEILRRLTLLIDDEKWEQHRVLVATRHADRSPGYLQNVQAGTVQPRSRWLQPGSQKFECAVMVYEAGWPVFEKLHPDLQDQIRRHVKGGAQ